MEENKKETVKDKLKKQTMGYMMAAFGFVAALAWNDAIKALIELLFPFSNSGVWIKFFYAILATALVVLVGQYILKMPSGK
ncbi:MAG: DUF5654 family protein [Candidatus Paceibacterota bacterium]